MFGEEFFAAIDHRDDVFHIVMTKVPLTSILKRSDLRGDEVGGIDDTNAVRVFPSDRVNGRGLPRRVVPTIGESQDVLVIGHHVDGKAANNPPAKRSLIAPVFTKAKFTKPFRKHVLFGS